MRFWGIIHVISLFQDRVEHWASQIDHHHHTCCIRKFSQPAQNHIPPNQCFHRNKLRWVDNLAVFFEVHKHRLIHLVISFSHRNFVYQQQVFISQQGMFLCLVGFEIMDLYRVINSCWATRFCPSSLHL